MATKPKESTIVGKDEKATSYNSHISSTKRTTEPSTTSYTTNNETSITPSNKNTSNNHLKATISLDSSSITPSKGSFLYSPSKSIDNKPERRRSFDKPQLSSNFTKHNQPSTLRSQNALLFPNIPIRNIKQSKPIILDRTSKNLNNRQRKIKQVYVVKSTPSVSIATTTNKVANDDNGSSNSKDLEKSNVGTKEVSKVVTNEEVTNQEVETMKEENEEIIKVDEHEHDQGLEKFDQLHHNQTNDEKVMYVAKEDEDEEEAKSESQEEKTCDKVEVEEYENDNDERNNKEEHFEAKEEEVVVNEKDDEEGGVLTKDDDTISENNKEELEEMVEEKEGVVGVKTREGVEKANVEAKPQILIQHGKKESQVSNDIIEETASKLRELERKNKVLALAGAFQTVIDYQTTSTSK